MALGKTGVETARYHLSSMSKNVIEAEKSNAEFIKLFKDDNFQKFVNETNKGAAINQQLQLLSDCITKVCSIINDMESKTENYLSIQEGINN